MSFWSVIRTSTVVAGVTLPRPKIVKDVLYCGHSREEAEAVLQAAVKLPINESSQFIDVVIKLKRSRHEEKNGTSARPGNGKRNGKGNPLA
jgi:hypothetical protein